MKQLNPLSVALLAALATVGCQSNPLGRTEAEAQVAVARYVERGEASVPELEQLAESRDELVASRARGALGQITGQWGARGDGLRWKRSVKEACNSDRPLLVLHLFGNFDEEFC